MNKKAYRLIVLIIAALFLTTGIPGAHPSNAENKPLRIIATTFPSYDWVRQILGDHLAEAELTLLLDNGIDLHSFQPSVQDIANIAACDLFLYNGGESDAWVSDILQTAANPNRTVISLLDALGSDVKMEEVVEGMEHDDDDSHADEADEDHDGEGEADEHVWLSLKNAQTLCAHIAHQLGRIDAENAPDYTANAERYIETLAALDAQYETALSNAATRTLLFADRFPFRYLTDDYQLSYYAAFVGCSAEIEASFETIAFLTEKLNELGLHSVMVTEGSNQSIAKTIIVNSTLQNQSILVLDSMQSVTAKDIADGISYLSLMERNLDVLISALR